MLRIKWIALFFVLLGVTGCYTQLAPAIYLENGDLGQEKGRAIKDVQVIWNGYYLLKRSEMSECGGGLNRII